MPPPGRDQREPMERIVRMATTLHHAGRDGVSAEKLIDVAGFAGGKDSISQLTREIRHMRKLGWEIENLRDVGEPAHYRMSSVDTRMRVKLTPTQQTALRRAVLLADRADLVQRLGLPAKSKPAELRSVVPTSASADALSVVIRAVRRNCLLRFRYNGVDRVLNPESLRAQNATWYLRGCEDRSDKLKAFVVSRMLDTTADAPATATRPPTSRHARLHPMSWEIDAPVDVTLTAPTEFAPDVRRWLSTPESETERGGETTMVYRVTNRAALRSRIYQLGTRVRVDGPDDVRQEILDELAEMAGE